MAGGARDRQRSTGERAREWVPGLLRWPLRQADRVDGPTGFRGLGSFIVTVVRHTLGDRAMDFAASVAFRTILGIFPLMLLAISILGMLGETQSLERLLDTLEESAAMPDQLVELLRTQFEELRDRAPSSFTAGAVVSLGFAMWALSSAARALMSGLNQMYDVEDPRNTPRRWAFSLVIATGAVALLLLATAIVVGGRGIIGQALGFVELGEEAGFAWALLRWPVLALLILLVFSLAYSLAPHRERRFQLLTPGTLTAFVLWLVFAVGFSAWVNDYADYGQLYGILTGVVALMLYSFWSAVILFVGAEVDHVRRVRREAVRRGDDDDTARSRIAAGEGT